MAPDVSSLNHARLGASEQRAILVIGDILFSTLALFMGFHFWVTGGNWLELSWHALHQRIDTWFYILPFVWPFMLVDLYDLHRARNWRAVIRGIATAAFTGLLIYALIYFTSDPNSLPRRGVAAFLFFASVLTLTWRFIFIRFFTDPAFLRRVLILGAGSSGRTLISAYRSVQPPPFTVIGFIDDDKEKIGQEVEGYAVLADSAQLLDLVEQYQLTHVVVAVLGEIRGATFQILLEAQECGVEITPMPRLYEELLGRVPIHHLESEWVIRSFVDHLSGSELYNLGKRLIDIVGSVVGMIILLIVFPFAALAICLDSGFPIFYMQIRSGRGGKAFSIHKFRTMSVNAEHDGKAKLTQENDPRITRIGNFMRRTRIDELPQFINVIRGEMSLVGPRAERPELVAQFQKQIPFYRSRLLVKPGITGWAQVNYGYVATVEDTAIKLEYDLYYIEHRSVLMDIIIMLRTIGTVLNFRGR